MADFSVEKICYFYILFKRINFIIFRYFMAEKELKASISLPNENYNDENTSYDQQLSLDSTTFEISTLNGYNFSH